MTKLNGLTQKFKNKAKFFPLYYAVLNLQSSSNKLEFMLLFMSLLLT